MNAKDRKPTIPQITELMKQIEAGRITRRHMTALLKNPDRLIDWEDDAEFNIRVDYRRSMGDMVKMGKHEHQPCNLSVVLDFENQPECPTCEGEPIEPTVVEFTVVLRKVRLDQDIDGIIQQLKEENLLPAKDEHLLAFGAKNPRIQEKFPIIAVGTDREAGCEYQGLCLDTYVGRRRAHALDITYGPDSGEIRVLAIKAGGYPGWTI